MKSVVNETARAHWSRVTKRFETLVAPAITGLPNWRVITWFPALVLLGAAILVILELGGTSSGMHWGILGSGEDPRLILGSPRGVRSDEWLVQQSWVVAQSNSGYPDTNQLFPGGMDMTVLAEIPSWHWSTIFRPHLWGYLLFGLDIGAAWFWWIPALVLVIACYLFVVTLLPRRPVSAALIAAAIYFTPLLQWFYSPSILMPAAWSLLAMAGVVWVLRDGRQRVRVLWALVIGYFAVTLAMGLYLPFILPSVLVFLAFSVGYLISMEGRPRGRDLRGRILPLGAAAVASLTVTGIWVASRWATFEAGQATVYPGQRSVPTGALLSRDPLLAGIGAAPWNQALRYTGSTVLGPNSSEAATVVLIGVFLIPALVWLIIDRWRSRRTLDWVPVLILALMAILAAYLFIPGWDAVAHLIQLDRIPAERVKYVFIVLGPLATVLVVQRVDSLPRHPPLWVGLACAGLATAVYAVLGVLIARTDSEVTSAASLWPLTAALIVMIVYLLFRRRLVIVSAALTLVVALVVGAGVNPVYKGLYDLSETAVGQEVARLDASDEGTWLGVGSYEVMAILTQVDVESLSGVQNYPPEEMWNEIDPRGTFENNWNRLGHIHWEVGDGPISMENPLPDVITVTFDPCSSFAQSEVDYVLSDVDLDGTNCLQNVEVVEQGLTEMRIYRVVAT